MLQLDADLLLEKNTLKSVFLVFTQHLFCLLENLEWGDCGADGRVGWRFKPHSI